MAKKKKTASKKKRQVKKRERKEVSHVTNPLAQVDDGLLRNYQRPSADLIYETLMRGGGEPFGAPFEVGVSSLTEKLVRFFKQRSFFGFETIEKSRKKNRRNKYTRYGASPYCGQYERKKEEESS